MEKERNYEENRLLTGVKLANLRIYEAAQRDQRYRGMGTTLVIALFCKEGLFLGHVGDSRCYLLREGGIEQLTEDHSLLNDYIKAKKLTKEEIENFPHKNVIVRALGMKDTVAVDINKREVKSGDVFLLCSDGLSGMVGDERLQQITSEHSDELDKACEKLITAANEAGGTDNITVALLRVDSE
jgi:protein phosphatase